MQSIFDIPIFAIMQFSEIIGQVEVKNHIREMVAQDRLGHALLFLGKEGNGSLSLGIALAQYMCCEKRVHAEAAAAAPSLFGEPEEKPASPAVLPDACGECSSCQKAAQFIHPDIHFSFPTVTKKSGTPALSTDYAPEWREFLKTYPYGNVYDWLQSIGAENKQGNITAAECNDIVRKLNLKSFESGYKILVLWMPEYLGNEGNKLLKLIEEPPPNTLFILVAENESLILQTILSRCQLIKIPALDNTIVAAALEARDKASADQAARVAALAEGNYREALQIIRHAEDDWMQLVTEWMTVLYRKNLLGQSKWVEEISRLGREKQKQFLRYFNHLLEQAIRYQIIGDQLNMPDQERDMAGRLNKIGDINQLQAIVEELDKASYYIERNANAKILFHALSIKIVHIIHNRVVVG